jgi:hypothetical protein
MGGIGVFSRRPQWEHNSTTKGSIRGMTTAPTQVAVARQSVWAAGLWALPHDAVATLLFF